MSSPVASVFQEVKDKGGGFAGGVMGKLIGSIAGVLVIITILKHTFYVTKVGQRSVLMRGGIPVRQRNGEWCFAWAKTFRMFRLWSVAVLFYQLALWRKSKQVGMYKVKRPGIGVKLPGWYDVIKVDVQRRRQKLDPFDVDCPDAQIAVKADLVTRVPCDDEGLEFHDYPALKIIHSHEADEIFESFGGTVLLELLEEVPREVRTNRELLNKLLVERAGAEFDRCAYRLEGVNLRQRSLTPIQKGIDGFAPKQDPADQQSAGKEASNVYTLPHAVVMTEALRPSAPSS